MNQNINKENFFNKLQIDFPKGMEHFCNWIDKYKEDVQWNLIFNEHLNIKFHDIPFEMQFGILMKYMTEITHFGEVISIEELKNGFTLLMKEIESNQYDNRN